MKQSDKCMVQVHTILGYIHKHVHKITVYMYILC